MYLIRMGEFGGTAGGCDKKTKPAEEAGCRTLRSASGRVPGWTPARSMKEHRARIVADGTGVFRRVDGESGLRLRDGRKRRHGR